MQLYSDFFEEYICMIFKFIVGEILNSNQVIMLEKGILDCYIICIKNFKNYNRG